MRTDESRMPVTVWEIRGHVASGKISVANGRKCFSTASKSNSRFSFLFKIDVISFVQRFVLNTTNLKFESIYFNENHCIYPYSCFIQPHRKSNDMKYSKISYLRYLKTKCGKIIGAAKAQWITLLRGSSACAECSAYVNLDTIQQFSSSFLFRILWKIP